MEPQPHQAEMVVVAIVTAARFRGRCCGICSRSRTRQKWLWSRLLQRLDSEAVVAGYVAAAAVQIASIQLASIPMASTPADQMVSTTKHLMIEVLTGSRISKESSGDLVRQSLSVKVLLPPGFFFCWLRTFWSFQGPGLRLNPPIKKQASILRPRHVWIISCGHASVHALSQSSACTVNARVHD